VIIATIRGIEVQQDPKTLRVFWTSGSDVDADGACGQNGKPFAYRYPDNEGLDALADAGWPHESWTDVLYSNGDGQPLTDGQGNAYSKTSYIWPHRSVADRSVDAATIPYVVVNPHVRTNCSGVVIGCHAIISYGEKFVEAVVADVSGGNDIGEISIAAAEALGIPSSPRTGGVSSGVSFQLFPGKAAQINSETYILQPQANNL
jgi:hypothetical protein